MRLVFSLFIIMLMPVMAQAETFVKNELPSSITQALNDAAATGNPLVVSAMADMIERHFPDMKGAVQDYVARIVTPATQVMASVIAMNTTSETMLLQDEIFLGKSDKATQTEAMAASLNGLTTGGL